MKAIDFPSTVKAHLIVLYILTSCSITLYAQSPGANFPKVGQPCPDFILPNVKYFHKKEVVLEDFKGKWLVLDFFTTGCTSCFASMPKIDSLSRKYQDKVQFFLVGKTDKYVEASYERFRKRFDLKLPVAYDSAIFTAFGIYGVPNYMFIDESGVVRAITSTINKDLIENVLAGRTVDLLTKRNKTERLKNSNGYDPNKPLLINGNGGNDTSFLYRSLLAHWQGSTYSFYREYISSRNKNIIQLIGLPIAELYYIAYGDTIETHPPAPNRSYGKLWREPMLEVSDTTKFITRSYSIQNFYDYSLYVPASKAKTSYLKAVMQNDLQNYFGYSVSVEKRLMPYWAIIVSDDRKVNRMKTKGGEECANGKSYLPHTGFSYRNCPISAVTNYLYSYYPNGKPFIDETGIEFNVDMDVDALREDFQGMKASLNKYGIDLIEGKKEMSVIVIRDKPDTP